MELRQFPYGRDNLGYLVYGDNEAMAVDGGAVEDVLSFLEREGLSLSLVTNTHSHGDHTCGNRGLLEATGADHVTVSELLSLAAVRLEDETLDVIHTPGHTADSVCLQGDGFLLSGDTLLNGRVGRCFTGDTEALFDSVGRLMELPDDTRVYGGHDYVEEYMDFAREVEPANPYIDRYLKMYRRNGVGASMEWEKRVDPFLRLSRPEIAAFLSDMGLAAGTAMQRFVSLLSVM